MRYKSWTRGRIRSSPSDNVLLVHGKLNRLEQAFNCPIKRRAYEIVRRSYSGLDVGLGRLEDMQVRICGSATIFKSHHHIHVALCSFWHSSRVWRFRGFILSLTTMKGVGLRDLWPPWLVPDIRTMIRPNFSKHNVVCLCIYHRIRYFEHSNACFKPQRILGPQKQSLRQLKSNHNELCNSS